MSFPRYPKYKDSGVEWLGEVPDHWDVMQLGRISVSWCDGPFGSGLKSEHYAEDGVRVVRLQNIRCTGFDGSDEVYVAREYYERELRGHDVIADDVLIAGLGDDNNTVGRACVTPAGIGPAMVKADCFRFRLNQNRACSAFVSAALCSSSEADAGFLATGSTRSRIPLSQMASRKVPVPPLEEQLRISAFLSSEIGKLEALVNEQERLIELLKEKRQAVISQAVTRGLNPKAPMKDSGIEWLGEVPAHWGLKRGRFLFHKLDLPPGADDGVVTAFRDGQVTLRENRRSEGFTIAVLEVGYQRVRAGDLVVHGMDAFAGAIGVSESTGKCTPEYAVLAPIGDDINGYFALVLRLMAKRNFIFVICPSVRERAPRFRFEALRDLVLPVPPVAEQKEILSFLESEVRRVDALVGQAQLAIDLLRERRTALISAAVTGQIDVCGASGAAA